MNRRDFLKGVSVAGAGVTASLAGAPAILAQRNPNDRVRVAVVGVGTRGHFLLGEAQDVSNTEIRVICDLYQPNIDRARNLAKNKEVQVTKDWEKAIDSPDVDAVIIATPDFWHAPMAIRAAKAKKDIYVEKGLCLTLQEAKDIRQAVRENKVVLQLGHNYNSLPSQHKARQIWQSGQLGKVTAIRTYIDRTNAHPEWQFYTDYNINELPKEAGPETIDWARFLGNQAPNRAFDAERFFRWRCFWEYSTGIAGDLMSHLWDSVNGVTGIGIPETAITHGGLYFWKNDRTVPDQWNVVFDYPKQDLAFTFNCTFSSRHVGEMAQYLGREFSMEVGGDYCRTYMAEWKPEYRSKLWQVRRKAEKLGLDPSELVIPPDYAFKKGELEVSNHMQDFFDCIRSRAVPRCGMDRAFEEAAAIMLSVEAFKQQRMVRWDPVKEEIV